MNLKECVITLDALHCQSETINTIVKQKATALIQVKANQGKLHASIDAQFQSLWLQTDSEQDASKKEYTGHGSNERLDAYVLPIEPDEKSLRKWPHLKTEISIVRDRQIKGKIGTYVTSYYVCTSEMTAQEVLKSVRLHWGIGNKQHWILDVTFKENDSRIRRDDGPENIGIIRRFCLNLCKLNPRKNSMAGKIKKCGWSDEYRQEVFFGQ